MGFVGMKDGKVGREGMRDGVGANPVAGIVYRTRLLIVPVLADQMGGRSQMQ